MTRDEVLAILKDIGCVVECPRCSYGTIKGQHTHTPSCPLLEVISWLEFIPSGITLVGMNCEYWQAHGLDFGQNTTIPVEFFAKKVKS